MRICGIMDRDGKIVLKTFIKQILQKELKEEIISLIVARSQVMKEIMNKKEVYIQILRSLNMCITYIFVSLSGIY